jgi:glycosyltransferase involved in cell wall biosynthesis
MNKPNGNLPRITIVTPSYNQGRFLEETINSVLNQDYSDLEYIIIDGGSKDNSINIINKYKKYLTYWVSERDTGQSHAINKGLCRATGELFSWLNSDDLLFPGSLKRLASFFINNSHVDVIIGGLLLGTESGRITRSYIPSPAPKWFMMNEAMDLFQPSMFLKKSIFHKIEHLDKALHCRMDADLLHRLVREKLCFGYVKYPLSFLRVHKARKGNVLLEQYEKERAIIMHRYKINIKIVYIARIMRKLQKTLNGTFLQNSKYSKLYNDQNIKDIWESFLQ